tara:strand:- start:4352 stop:5092 length:741 start_codon:yes stop_codon:yes gene_type:complete
MVLIKGFIIMNAILTTTNTNDTNKVVSVPMQTIASLKTVISEWLVIKSNAIDATDKQSKACAQVSYLVFTALSEGLDLAPLKALYTKEVWKSVKRPFSDASTLYTFLSNGNHLEVESDKGFSGTVRIRTVLDKEITLSTATTAMRKTKKALADEDKALVSEVQTSIEAYLRSDEVLTSHKGIPSDALVTRLALQGKLSDARAIGDKALLAESNAIDKENKAQEVKTAIALLKASGYEVKASKPSKK